MVHIFREISKTLMIILIWGMPFYMAVSLEDLRYLWALPFSLFANIGIFGHYEKLETLNESDNEDTQETGE